MRATQPVLLGLLMSSNSISSPALSIWQSGFSKTAAHDVTPAAASRPIVPHWMIQIQVNCSHEVYCTLYTLLYTLYIRYSCSSIAIKTAVLWRVLQHGEGKKTVFIKFSKYGTLFRQISTWLTLFNLLVVNLEEQGLTVTSSHITHSQRRNVKHEIYPMDMWNIPSCLK